MNERNQNELLNRTDNPKFPFVGSLEDGESFEYLLLSHTQDKAEFAILEWFVNRVKLNINARLDLYLPLTLSVEYKLRGHIPGMIVGVEKSEEMGGRYLSSFVN